MSGKRQLPDERREAVDAVAFALGSISSPDSPNPESMAQVFVNGVEKVIANYRDQQEVMVELQAAVDRRLRALSVALAHGGWEEFARGER